MAKWERKREKSMKGYVSMCVCLYVIDDDDDMPNKKCCLFIIKSIDVPLLLLSDATRANLRPL